MTVMYWLGGRFVRLSVNVRYCGTAVASPLAPATLQHIGQFTWQHCAW